MPVVKNCSATAEVSIDAGQIAEPLACKSWADRVPQCAPGVPPRKIFRGDLESYAVVLESLLHRCFMAAAPVDHLSVKAASRRYAVPDGDVKAQHA
jgi:hypothetical protein